MDAMDIFETVERGLAYEAELPINWCPSDKTGLANEEVVTANAIAAAHRW